MNSVILLWLLAVATFWGLDSIATAKSLCDTKEKEFFSCTIGRKTASVCGSTDLSGKSGYLQYRFGIDRNSLELQFPEVAESPSKIFKIGFNGSAKSSLINLQFKISSYSYTIFNERAAFGDNGAGIAILAPSGKLTRFSCKEADPKDSLYKLAEGLGLKSLPDESLYGLTMDATWSPANFNADLLQGVRTHDFALVTNALDGGADPNFHGETDAGVLGAVADNEISATSNQVDSRRFEDETNRMVKLLLSRGAAPSIQSLHILAMRGQGQATKLILDAGWPVDYRVRLYAGASLGDISLVDDSLAHGASPNDSLEGESIVKTSIFRAGHYGRMLSEIRNAGLSDKSIEDLQDANLKVLDRLLSSGGKIDEGSATQGGGDLVTMYSHDGASEAMRPVWTILIGHSTVTARKNALAWLRLAASAAIKKNDKNLAWLLERLGT